MKLSKRIVLSLITILMSIGIFAVSVDQARADSGFSTSCKLDKVLQGDENQKHATLGLSCENSGRQFINLENHIASNDGTLAWQRNGNFQETCFDSFIENNHILKSTCKKTDGSIVDSQLDLEKKFLVEGRAYVVYMGGSVVDCTQCCGNPKYPNAVCGSPENPQYSCSFQCAYSLPFNPIP